jgi:hypothetical protein
VGQIACHLAYEISVGKLQHFQGNNTYIMSTDVQHCTSGSDAITRCVHKIPKSLGHLPNTQGQVPNPCGKIPNP